MGDLENFVKHEGTRLMRLAYVLTGNQHDAEDLLQETMIRLHTRWDRVSGAANMNAYSRRVLVNCHLSARRRKSLRTIPWSDAYAPVQTDETALVEARDLLRQSLNRLPPRQRTAVVLRYYEHLETKEIGLLMGIGETSVRSAISRGLEMLRSWLREETDRIETRDGSV